MSAWPLIVILLEVAGFIVLLLLSLLFFDRRYKRRKNEDAHHPVRHGFHQTSEVFIDPKDGLRYRVYYNPTTGERDYVQEN